MFKLYSSTTVHLQLATDYYCTFNTVAWTWHVTFKREILLLNTQLYPLSFMTIISHLKPDVIPVYTTSCNIEKFSSLPAEYNLSYSSKKNSHYFLTQDQSSSIYDTYGLCFLWRRNLISTLWLPFWNSVRH